MAFAFLTDKNLNDRYVAAKQYTDALTIPFPEFERIARNRPHLGIDPNYPKTTDGTTASIIRKTPRRIIQQLPTGRVISDDGGWLGIVADFIYNKKILLHANEEYDLIQKCWSVVEAGLSFGSCATYTPFLNHNGEFSPDVTGIYWGDVMVQPGKKSAQSCSYIFMRSWWQKADIEALIDKEKKLAANAKKRGAKYESTWDLVALNKIKDAVVTKDFKAVTPTEKERQTQPNSGVEFVTGFQKGVSSKFYTFNPTTQEIIRTKVNKDPRGNMPIDFMYGDIDGSNPLGRGIIELVGGLQNLIDSDMQMYQYNRALMLAPPIIKSGNFSKTKVKFVPNAIIDVGMADPNTAIVPLKIDTSAVINYPALYGLQKSQLLNLVSSPDQSISADVGNPGFSKTPQGLKQQQATISVDDNYVRKMFEAWFQSWSETAVNLYFAEQSGIQELQLDKATSMKLRELPGFDQSLLSEDNKIKVDFDTDTPILKFRVDPSTTSVKDTAAQVQDATGLLDIVMKYPMLNANFGGPIDVDVLARRIVVNSGIDDPEQVAPEPTQAQIQSKEEQKNKISPFSPMFDKPAIRMAYADLPPAAQIQLLGNVGIQVGMQDVLAGPVLDPNERGNNALTPMSDPNLLMPGGQPGQVGAGTNPIDIGDIYKQTTDPQVKAEIEQMAGLHPSPSNTQNAQDTSTSQHLSDQVGNLGNAMNIANPPPEQPAQQSAQPAKGQVAQSAQPQQPQQQPPPQQLNAQDHQIISQLQQMGFTTEQINQAVQMLNAGYNEQDVIKMLQGGK